MMLQRRALLGAAASVPLIGKVRAQQQVIRIGVLTDMSGQYRDNSGPTSVIAARQAVEDFGAASRGITVEVLSADHQNKADVGAGVARQWIDRDGVDAIFDVNNTAIALAVNGVVREKNKVAINTGAASSDLTGKACNPNLIHWAPDTWCDSHTIGGALLKQGRKKWFLIVADYSFGKQLQNDVTQLVQSDGGQIVGSALFPFPGTTDFSAQLVQAQASGADVIGLCSAGGDSENCVKQAHEFGVSKSGQKIAAMVMFITEAHSMGLETAQGLFMTETFYWDLNDRTRAFTDRIRPKTPHNWPSALHASCYAGVTHYLKAVAAMGVPRAKASGLETIETMKRMPTDDDAFGPGSIRPDGRKLTPAYLFQVKTPAESRGEWDIYKVIETIPADRAFRPMNEGNCPLVKA